MIDLQTRLLLFLVVILWGTSGALQKVAVQRMATPPMQLINASTILLIICIYYFFYISNKGFTTSSMSWTWSGVAFSILAAIASSIGSIIFIYLLRGRDVSSLVGYAACYPLVTFIIAIIFLGESFSVMRLIGICFVLLGLSFIGR